MTKRIRKLVVDTGNGVETLEIPPGETATLEVSTLAAA